jgi:hypothetical protein
MTMGLYDDDAPITSGFQGADEYIDAKKFYDRFEDALKLRQPESVVANQLYQLNLQLEKALKKFPEHEDVKKWKAKADLIGSKISKTPASGPETDAYRNNWSQPAETLYRFYHMARAAEVTGMWSDALKWANAYIDAFDTYTEPGSTQTLATWYRPVGDDWKKTHAGWRDEMKALQATAKAKN